MFGEIIDGRGRWGGEGLSLWESSQVEQLLQLLDNKRLLKEGEGTTDKWL